jgi:hypothetical protein
MKNRKKHRNRGKEIYRYGKTVANTESLAKREQWLRYGWRFALLTFFVLKPGLSLETLLELLRWIGKLF